MKAFESAGLVNKVLIDSVPFGVHCSVNELFVKSLKIKGAIMITLSKKMRKIYALPIEAGWYVHRASNHLIWRHPDGGQCPTAKTPSDHRALKNALSNFRAQDRKNGRESTY